MEFQFKPDWREALMWGLWWFATVTAIILIVLRLLGVL